MWIGQTLFVLGVLALVWRASQPPDDDDQSGGKLQPIYIKNNK